MQTTNDSNPHSMDNQPHKNPLRVGWFALFATMLALAGLIALTRLQTVTASQVSETTSTDGGLVSIWPTEYIQQITTSGRYFINMTGRSLAYYTDKNHTTQQLHLAYGGNGLYYATSTWISPTWGAWTTEVVDNSPDVGEWASIAVDRNNVPHIAYFDKGNGCLKYAVKDPTWTIFTIDCDNTLLPTSETSAVLSEDGSIQLEPTVKPLTQNTPAEATSTPLAIPDSGSGMYTSIAIDSYGHVHISYAKYYPRNDGGGSVNIYHKLKYAYIDSSSTSIYQITEPGNASLDEGLYTSIFIDSRDRPHIAFLDDTHDKVRYVFSPSDGRWKFSYPTATGIGNYSNVGGWNSLVLKPSKPQDVAYITYYDQSHGALKLAKGTYYDSYGGNTRFKNYVWENSTIDSSNDTGLFSSLAVYGSKGFGVSYFDESLDDLKYATGNINSWARSTVTGTNSRAGRYTSLVYDFSLIPHITYFDFSDGNMYEAYFTNKKWHFRPIDNSMILGSASLSLDSTEKPHVLMYNGLLGSIEMASRTSTPQWLGDTVIASRLSPDNKISLKVDSSNHYHIAYYDPINKDLVYGYHNGLGWTFTKVDETGDVGQNPSLGLLNDKPLISYYDATNGALKLATFDGSLWSIETVNHQSNTTGHYSSLKVTSSGIYISYDDASSGLWMAYSPSMSSHAWTLLNVDNTSGAGKFSSIDVDSSGLPYIAYYDTDSHSLKVASATSSSTPFGFSSATIDSGDDVGKYCSLTTDSTGQIHVSYYNATKGDLKYALFDGSNWSTQIVDQGGDVGLWSEIVVDPGTNIPHILYYDATRQEWKYTYDAAKPIISTIFLPAILR